MALYPLHLDISVSECLKEKRDEEE